MADIEKQDKKETTEEKLVEDKKGAPTSTQDKSGTIISKTVKKSSFSDFFKKGLDWQSLLKLLKGTRPVTGVKQSNLRLLEVDLIKNEVVVLFDWRKNFFNLFVFLLLTAGVIGEAYYLLSIWEKKQVYNKNDYLKSEIANIDNKIQAIQEESEKAVAFRNNLQNALPIFNRHVYWSNFFDFLEANTLSDLYYLAFDGTTSGTYSLPARVKDYRAINFQLDRMLRATSTVLSASIANEEVNSAAKPNEKVGVSFNLNLNILPDIFTK